MKTPLGQNGFTLIEVMIALVISTIVLAAAGTAFFNMQSTSMDVDQRSNMSINSRGAMYIIEENIRLLGFNPARDFNPNNIIVSATGAFLSFNRNDLANPGVAPDDTISIGLNLADDGDGGGRDGFADNGATSLVVDTQNVSDDIEALRFAYAYDNNGDGNVELSLNNFIRWAIDSDGDGELDSFLDTDDDGDIDQDDAVGGTAMATTVDIADIKAVKVWLVVRSQNQVKGASEADTFVVGDQRYTPNDNFAHTLYTTTIRTRNKS